MTASRTRRSRKHGTRNPEIGVQCTSNDFIRGTLNSESRTMAIDSPSLFIDSDILTFRQTPASEYRVPYTFVESLNEGTLFDRSVRTFEQAARTQRLYDVVVGG